MILEKDPGGDFDLYHIAESWATGCRGTGKSRWSLDCNVALSTQGSVAEGEGEDATNDVEQVIIIRISSF